MSSIKEGGALVELFDPRMGQWLAMLPREVSFAAIWSPRREAAMLLSSSVVDKLAKDWPYLNGCKRMEVA